MILQDRSQYSSSTCSTIYLCILKIISGEADGIFALKSSKWLVNNTGWCDNLSWRDGQEYQAIWIFWKSLVEFGLVRDRFFVSQVISYHCLYCLVKPLIGWRFCHCAYLTLGIIIHHTLSVTDPLTLSDYAADLLRGIYSVLMTGYTQDKRYPWRFFRRLIIIARWWQCIWCEGLRGRSERLMSFDPRQRGNIALSCNHPPVCNTVSGVSLVPLEWFHFTASVYITQIAQNLTAPKFEFECIKKCMIITSFRQFHCQSKS